MSRFTGGFVEDFECNTSNHVDYYLPKPTVSYPYCLEPVSNGNYSIVRESGNQNSGECGSTFSDPNIGEYDYIKAMGCDSTKLFNLMANYRNQIKLLEIKAKNGTITQAEKAKLAWLKRHLRYAVNQWAWCLRKNGKYPELYSWYKSQGDKEFAIQAAEVKVLMHQYDVAINEMKEIEREYSFDHDVIDAIILSINQVRKDVPILPVTASELQLLRNVAAKPDPFATYGRALLFRLTSEKIEPLLPDTQAPRASKYKEVDISERYVVSPIPADDILNIEIINFKGEEHQYKMVDMSGRILKQGSLQSSNKLDVSDLEPAVYLLHIITAGDVASVRKFVKIN